jgi:hypothetical protein
MSDIELYDATRGIWRVGSRCEAAKYAFAIHDGVIREVYRITKWLPAGSTLTTRDPKEMEDPARREFVGVLADPRLRKQYINKAVERRQFPRGAQNPIRYVNVPAVRTHAANRKRADGRSARTTGRPS